MGKYLLRRLVLLIPTLFIVTVLVFLVVRLLPGDVLSITLGEADATQEELAAERAKLGFDRPIYEQYVTWMGSILRGNLGRSLWSGRPIAADLAQKIPVTIELGLLAVLFSILIGIPTGIISAMRQDSAIDYIARSLTIGGLSIPAFWLATMIILALSLWLNYTPPLTYTTLTEDPLTNLQQFVLPAIFLGIHNAATLMRMTRTALLEVVRQDYIRTAWAKGLSERVILVRHAMKNSLIPVVTILGVEMAAVVGGSVVMETIFGLPGVGQYVYNVVLHRDYPAIQAINLFLASFIMVINLGVDLSLGFFDPRIRLR